MEDEKDKEQKALQNKEVDSNGTEETKDPANEVQGKDGNGAPVTEKMPRDVFIERIRATRPEGKYDEDEQELYRQAGSVLDEFEANNNKYKELSEKLASRFNSNPDEAQVLIAYLEGEPLLASIRKYMGDEALTMKEGDEGWDEYLKAGEERKADRERLMSYAKELKENTTASDAAFEEWAQEQGLDDEQKRAIWDLIQNDLSELMKGKVSKELLNRYNKAQNHDDDVKGAREQGEIEGRNKNIEAKKNRMKGSGLPNGDAGGRLNGGTNSTGNSTADWLSSRSWKA